MSVLKQLFGIALLGLIGYGGYQAYERFTFARASNTSAEEQAAEQPLGTPVELTRAARTRVEASVEAVGSTLARRAVEMVSLASGRVERIHFSPGQEVAAGDVLVSLDDDIERADLAEAEAALDEARQALERARRMRESSTVSQASLETLVSQHARARAALDRARRRLADREVRAPFAGVTGLARVDPGAVVDDSTVITTLDDRREIDVEFSLPETLYGRIRPGMRVSARAAAFPGRVFDGGIVSIDTRVDPAGRSFKVRARLPNQDLTLPAGMFLHLTVVLDVRQALMIPEEAVVAEGDKTYVWVADAGDRAVRREVSLGQREADAVEVLTGLAEGDRVVVRGVQRLSDGALMRILGVRAAPAAGGASA